MAFVFTKGINMTNQKQIRAAFWEFNPHLSRKKYKGDYVTDTRVAFCDFVDYLYRNGEISEALCNRATL
jgi:hypothetical protein